MVPWREVMRLRHRLIHGYDTIDDEVLAGVVTDDLPPLIVRLRAALRGLA